VTDTLLLIDTTHTQKTLRECVCGCNDVCRGGAWLQSVLTEFFRLKPNEVVVPWNGPRLPVLSSCVLNWSWLSFCLIRRYVTALLDKSTRPFTCTGWSKSHLTLDIWHVSAVIKRFCAIVSMLTCVCRNKHFVSRYITRELFVTVGSVYYLHNVAYLCSCNIWRHIWLIRTVSKV